MLVRMFEEYYAEQMKCPEYRGEWEALQGELKEEKERIEVDIDERIEESVDVYFAEQMKDPEYRREWEALQPEYEKELAMIEAELRVMRRKSPASRRIRMMRIAHQFGKERGL